MSDRPKITCLVGSTRFRREYEEAFRAEEHAGRICLTVPCYKSDPCCKTRPEQDRLDVLHRHKIDLADEVLVINPGRYLGASTRGEISYARSLGKPIRWLEAPGGDAP
jgi:hypothetical protein